MLKNSFYKKIKQLVWVLVFNIVASNIVASNLVASNALADTERQIDLTDFQTQYFRTVLIKYVNQERVDKNQIALSASEKLNSAAQQHAIAMIEYDFFSHTSPLKRSRNLNDRLINEGIKNVYAAENLSLEFAIELNANQPFYTRLHPEDNEPIFSLQHNGQAIPAHNYKTLAIKTLQSWINSKKHHSNILNDNYDSVGVGAALSRNAQQVPIVKIVVVFAGLSI